MVESRAQRDQRIRADEARMVRIEDAMEAQKELLQAVRREFNVLGSEVREHAQKDEERFTSVDSRLMGTQSQLTGMQSQLSGIERQLTDILKISEDRTRRISKVEEGVATLDNAVYTREGYNRIEILEVASRDNDIKLNVWKSQLAWLFSGGVGVILLRLALTMAGVEVP